MMKDHKHLFKNIGGGYMMMGDPKTMCDDHSKCQLPQTCAGYQSAEGDLENEINAILPILNCELTTDGKMNMIRKIVRGIVQKTEQEYKRYMKCQADREEETDKEMAVLENKLQKAEQEARQQTAKDCIEIVQEIQKLADNRPEMLEMKGEKYTEGYEIARKDIPDAIKRKITALFR